MKKPQNPMTCFPPSAGVAIESSTAAMPPELAGGGDPRIIGQNRNIPQILRHFGLKMQPLGSFTYLPVGIPPDIQFLLLGVLAADRN
jgi:hypothetical protein